MFSDGCLGTRTRAGALLDYEHVGKTVLIQEREGEGQEPMAPVPGFWIEGESATECPLREVSMCS